jgi:hypothetical protein
MATSSRVRIISVLVYVWVCKLQCVCLVLVLGLDFIQQLRASSYYTAILGPWTVELMPSVLCGCGISCSCILIRLSEFT